MVCLLTDLFLHYLLVGLFATAWIFFFTYNVGVEFQYISGQTTFQPQLAEVDSVKEYL